MLPVEKRALTLVVSEPGRPAKRRFLTLVELAESCGCQVELAERLFRIGLLDPEAPRPEPLFEEAQLFRLRRALRLKRDLGVSVDSLPLVLDLLDRIEELEAELRRR